MSYVRLVFMLVTLCYSVVR